MSADETARTSSLHGHPQNVFLYRFGMRLSSCHTWSPSFCGERGGFVKRAWNSSVSDNLVLLHHKHKDTGFRVPRMTLSSLHHHLRVLQNDPLDVSTFLFVVQKLKTMFVQNTSQESPNTSVYHWPKTISMLESPCCEHGHFKCMRAVSRAEGHIHLTNQDVQFVCVELTLQTRQKGLFVFVFLTYGAPLGWGENQKEVQGSTWRSKARIPQFLSGPKANVDCSREKISPTAPPPSLMRRTPLLPRSVLSTFEVWKLL